MRCDLFSRNLQPSSWMSQNYFHAYVLPPLQIRPTVIREACPRPLPKWMKNILTMIAGESCGKQVPEQRGDLGGVGQEPEADDKNGFRQRAEAGWAEQVTGVFSPRSQPHHIKCWSTGSLGYRKRSWNEQLNEQSLQNLSSRGSKKNFSWSVILCNLHDWLHNIDERLARIWSSWSCLPKRRWRGRRSWKIKSWAFSRSSSPPREGKLFDLISVKVKVSTKSIVTLGESSGKKYQKWYTIDALGAIFAIFKYSHFGHF